MKVLAIHYRVGKTDGVSLEIGAWKQIWEKQGREVVLAGGDQSLGADYVIPGLENQLDPEVFSLDEEAFGGLKKLNIHQFEDKYRRHQNVLRRKFDEMLSVSRPDRVVVSNIFAVGENVAAAGALAGALKATGVATVGIHHDFYWENIRYKKPSCRLVEEQLEEFFPPVGDWIVHGVINSIARKELSMRKGVVGTLVYDTLDFTKANTDKNGICKKMLEAYGVKKDDLVILQATRIVRRKNVELAMDFAATMQKRTTRRVVLVMAGYAEKRDKNYQKILQEYARTSGIILVELNGLASIFAQASGEKCDLMSVYPYASVVTYPSEYEGFGNQFLEAVYAKKPVVIWEYPVYKTDIKPLGFEVVSLGDSLSFETRTGLAKVPVSVMGQAVEETVDLLKDETRRTAMVEKNFAIGKANFSYDQTARVWRKLLDGS